MVSPALNGGCRRRCFNAIAMPMMRRTQRREVQFRSKMRTQPESESEKLNCFFLWAWIDSRWITDLNGALSYVYLTPLILLENTKLSFSDPNTFLFVQTTPAMATSSPMTSPSSQQSHDLLLTSRTTTKHPPPPPSFACRHWK